MVRSVTPPTRRTENAEMGLVGDLVAAGVLLLLVPLLPFLAVLWLLDRLTGGARGTVGRTGRSHARPEREG